MRKLRKFWLRKTEFINSRAWNWAQVFCLYKQSSSLLPACAFPGVHPRHSRTQLGATERGTPPVGMERSILQMTFPSGGSPPSTQEKPCSSTRKGLLPAESWSIIAGTASGKHRLGVLFTPMPMQTLRVSSTPRHSEPISASSAALALHVPWTCRLPPYTWATARSPRGWATVAIQVSAQIPPPQRGFF